MHHEFLALFSVDASASPLAKGIAGPGWYESSWDLRRGLDIAEDFDSDPPPRRRPLQGATAPACRRVAARS